MSQETLKNILIVDDDYGDRNQIKRAIMTARPAWRCAEAASIRDALAACGENAFDSIKSGDVDAAFRHYQKSDAFDCAIVDYRLPADNGLEGVSALRERFPFMAIIMATGQGDEMIATEAMKRGASDYVRKKDLTKDYITRAIETAIEKAGLQRIVAKLAAESEDESAEDPRPLRDKNKFPWIQ